MTRRKPTAAELVRQLAEVLKQQPDTPANDDALTEEDERELQERAERAAERMRRARNR